MSITTPNNILWLCEQVLKEKDVLGYPRALTLLRDLTKDVPSQYHNEAAEVVYGPGPNLKTESGSPERHIEESDSVNLSGPREWSGPIAGRMLSEREWRKLEERVR